MAEGQKSLPKWILIVSGLFALFELMVSLSLYLSPAVAKKGWRWCISGKGMFIQNPSASEYVG